MDKEKLKERLEILKTKLAFLKPWDMDDDDIGDDLEIRQFRATDEKSSTRWQEDTTELPGGVQWKRYTAALAVVLVVLIGAGFWYYNGHHTFTEYVVTSTTECLDIAGTEYVTLGSSIIKYSPDGVFCVNSKNETKWSAVFSMQTPISDVCQKTMVIAEQQGKQVYVLNEDGLLGNFETQLPILRAHVSAQGVVALLQPDEDVTWINLYDSAGTQIASVKTTVQDSGYPVDMALTPNASRMMVSYLGVDQGALVGKIAFYDFSSASESDESHLTGTLEYSGRVFPEVYYADASTPVALSDNGFIVFKNSRTPEERENVTLEKEIVSSFHDEDYVGFVYNNEAEDCRYEMELYQYGGRQVMQEAFDCDYTEVKMDQGEILLYDAKSCTVYSTSGMLHFSSDYEKQVAYFTKTSGFRRYLIITGDSIDRIRIS